MNGIAVICASAIDVTKDWLPAALAVLALAISMIALWQTHFARSRVLAAAGNATLAVYPIRGDGSKWYILSLEAPVTLANPGAKPVQVTGLRVNARFTDIDVGPQTCDLPATFVVQDHDHGLREDGRFAWLHVATRIWQPILILSRSDIAHTVVFERRIEHPIGGRIEFDLEAFTQPSGKWRQLARWNLNLTPSLFSVAIRSRGPAVNFPPEDSPNTPRNTDPADLLNRVRVSETDLPEPPFVGASHLDYAEWNEELRADASSPNSEGDDAHEEA